jgi:hypothetical protein
MGRRKRNVNSTPQKNSLEDLVGNEENEYQVPDPNRTVINTTNELNDTLKISQREYHG